MPFFDHSQAGVDEEQVFGALNRDTGCRWKEDAKAAREKMQVRVEAGFADANQLGTHDPRRYFDAMSGPWPSTQHIPAQGDIWHCSLLIATFHCIFFTGTGFRPSQPHTIHDMIQRV